MRNYYFTGVIITIYVLFFFLVSPLHEFPSGDAWVHSMAVKGFLDTYQIKIPQLCPSSLIFQILWGAVFCLFSGGFSFGMLNFSTFILSMLGAISFYLILRRLKVREILCIFGALCLIFNPLYFFLSFTFMLDVPCLSLMLLSILLYLKGLDEDNDKILFFGSIVSAASFLIKQFGIFIPLSLAIYMFVTYKKNALLLKKIIVSCIVPFLVFSIYSIWYISLYLPDSLTAFYYPFSSASHSYSARYSYLKDVPRNVFAVLLYLGLFISPLLLGSLAIIKKVLKNKIVLIIVILFTVILIRWTYSLSRIAP